MTFASLNLVPRVENTRSGENSDLDASVAFSLGADYYFLAKQDYNQIYLELENAKLQTDPFSDNYQSVRNILFQLLSLKRAWNGFGALDLGCFDVYLFLRPDLEYLDDLRIEHIDMVKKNRKSILLPSWHSWGGLNDRFCVASYEAAEVYALRFDNVTTYCHSHSLHSESFLAHSLTKADCKIGALDIRANRVRVHGWIRPEDFSETNISLPKTPSSFEYSRASGLKLRS